MLHVRLKFGAGLGLAALVAAATPAAAQTPPPDEGSPVEATAEPAPSPNSAVFNGYVRSFYFTRQNASNNYGAVNQATWNTGVALDAAYKFPGVPWSLGVTYFYANPLDGPCAAAANHAKGDPCVTQTPPNTHPDDTLPGFTLSTFDAAYLSYKAYGYAGTLGYQLFESPWANPSDSRLKPAAFAGGDLAFSGLRNWTFEAADMLAFENRTSSAFSRQTLLTSYPAGARGLPGNINAPGGLGITTDGFAYLKAGFANEPSGFSAAGYFYGVSDLVSIVWFDGEYTLTAVRWRPFIALQGGVESNAGRSYLGKIASQETGVQVGADPSKNLRFTAGFDSIPWRRDAIYLPRKVSCGSNYQIGAKGATLAYFLPLNAAQCATASDGTTQIYYGGWASPYTDNYSTDPFFTTSVTQGMADRRAPGTSWKVAVTYTSGDKRLVVAATDAWYDYGNVLAPQRTSIWTLDGRYYLSRLSGGRYRGLSLCYRYAERTQTNTEVLGGIPLFKYNRAQLEYDW